MMEIVVKARSLTRELIFMLISVVFMLPIARVFADGNDTFWPGEIWQDVAGTHINAHGGGILVYDDVYYWFGQHMVEGEAGNRAEVGVSCYSSSDLLTWKREGIALPVVDELGHDIERGCILERPKVIYNQATKKFVMWFHLELKGEKYRSARCAVAVADEVAGPYRYLRSLRPNAGKWPVNLSEEERLRYSEIVERNGWEELPKEEKFLVRDFAGGQMSRDMTLFVDEDQKAYLITASEENATLHIHELTEDYLNFNGTYSRQFVGRYMEAPALFKYNGQYFIYASGCSGWAPNAARSAVAKNLHGPWTELGNPCRGVNPALNLGPEKTFGAQSTYVLPVDPNQGKFIAMFDIWRPKNAIDGRYVWLPVEFESGAPVVRWRNSWKFSDFFDAE